MNRQDETELFALLARNQHFRNWVQFKLDAELRVLVQNTDVEQLRKAQGRAQLLQHIQDLLDKSPTAMDR